MTQDEANECLRQKMEEDGKNIEDYRGLSGTHDELYIGNTNKNSNIAGNNSSNSAAAEPTPVNVEILTQKKSL